jgi:hypothetical protein
MHILTIVSFADIKDVTMKGFYSFYQFAFTSYFQTFSHVRALRCCWMFKRLVQTGEMEVTNVSTSQLS